MKIVKVHWHTGYECYMTLSKQNWTTAPRLVHAQRFDLREANLVAQAVRQQTCGFANVSVEDA